MIHAEVQVLVGLPTNYDVDHLDDDVDHLDDDLDHIDDKRCL